MYFLRPTYCPYIHSFFLSLLSILHQPLSFHSKNPHVLRAVTLYVLHSFNLFCIAIDPSYLVFHVTIFHFQEFELLSHIQTNKSTKHTS